MIKEYTSSSFVRKLKYIKNILTRNSLGDKISWLIMFIRAHKRLPSNKLLFNDVLYKIKTTDEILDPLRVFVTDKEFVKLYIKSTIGDQYNVPTIAILKNTHEIDSFNFPPNCCIKPTHASGLVILRKNSEEIDKERIKKWFSLNYYTISQERNYKHLKPKVIIEPLIFDSLNVEDYKVFCFNGKARFIQLDLNRYIDHRRAIFDLNWKLQDFTISYPKPETNTKIEKPKNLEEMIIIAENLSRNFGFVRVDLYSNGEKCLVGEITNCHGSADEKFIPKESEYLVSKRFFSKNQ